MTGVLVLACAKAARDASDAVLLPLLLFQCPGCDAGDDVFLQ